MVRGTGMKRKIKARRIECETCKAKFIPKREATIEEKGIYLNNRYTDYYDVMNCPACGCQIVLAERMLVNSAIVDI